MPRSSRTQSSQSKHNQKVAELAKKYENKGYEVQAEIPGYKTPRGIGGFRPDIIVKKGQYVTIIEIETPDSAGKVRDMQQQAAFQRAARWNRNTHYRREVTD